MHVDLASGNSIQIVPLQGLKAKHRDAFEGGPKLYVKFDSDGNPDMSGMPLSMTIAKAQRNALMASLISSWTFRRLDDEGNPVGDILPVPTWDGDELHNGESFGELPIEDILEIEELLKPYIDKIQRKPDPKTMTTAGSTAA